MMRRTAILMVAWLVAWSALYILLLALELYWNFFDWFPRFDLKAVSLVVALLVSLAATWRLARASLDRITRMFSLAGCLALLGLGLYVLPPEAKTEGLFARQLPSPFWYRGGRLLAMSCPSLFWARALLASRCTGLLAGGARFLACRKL